MIEIPNAQAEQLILSKLMTNYEYTSLLSENFDKRYFQNSRIATLSETIIKYYQKYSKIPTRPVLEMILTKLSEAGNIDIAECIKEIDVSCSLNISNDDQFVKDAIISFLQQQGAYYAIMDNIEHIEKKKDVSKCIETLQKISAITFNNELGFNYYDDLDKHLAEVANPEDKLPTGFKQLDKITNGGVLKDGRCLFVFMAPTGIGKSLFMSNMAVNCMMNNKFPLIISLEMSELVYGKRVDAHISGEDVNMLHMNTPVLKERIMDFKGLYGNSKLIIKEFPPSSINCNHIKAYIEKLNKRGLYPDIVFVDYINLLLPNNFKSSDGDSYARVGEITKDMRSLSYVFRKPFITATQTNRNGFNSSDLALTDVSESAQVLHHADAIAGIFQVDGDREANRINTIMLKNRFGGDIGKHHEYFINYRTLRIQDMFLVAPKEQDSDVSNDIITDLQNI